MYSKIRVAGVVCTAMIDSGASRDIIDANLAKRLNLSLKIVPEIAMHMADDTQVICRQVADKTVIKFTAVDKPPFKDIIDLSVLDLKGKFDLILGMPFLMRRNPKIDWRRKCMTFENNHTVCNSSVSRIRACAAATLPGNWIQHED